jgi:hypothetical protein
MSFPEENRDAVRTSYTEGSLFEFELSSLRGRHTLQTLKFKRQTKLIFQAFPVSNHNLQVEL